MLIGTKWTFITYKNFITIVHVNSFVHVFLIPKYNFNFLIDQTRYTCNIAIIIDIDFAFTVYLCSLNINVPESDILSPN